jgi:hypothetical protein
MDADNRERGDNEFVTFLRKRAVLIFLVMDVPLILSFVVVLHLLFEQDDTLPRLIFGLFAVIIGCLVVVVSLVVHGTWYPGRPDRGPGDGGIDLQGAPVPRKPLPSHLSSGAAIDLDEGHS